MVYSKSIFLEGGVRAFCKGKNLFILKSNFLPHLDENLVQELFLVPPHT